MPFARSISLRQLAGWQLLGLAAVCALATLVVLGAAPRPATTATSTTPLPFATGSAFAPLPGAAVGPLAEAGTRARVASRYGRLPLAFEPNRGQFDKTARWVAHGPGYTLSLTRRAAVLAPAAGKAGALSITLSGANPSAAMVGESALPGKVNYLTGRDSSRWHTNVPTFARVRYKSAWPGIDAAFYGNQGRLEYDFDVAPHADPTQIGLSISGARRLRVDRHGNLLMSMPGGSVRQLTPRAYQALGGTRRRVASRYIVKGHEVRVRVGAYDHRRPLVIDPVLAYSTLLGGPSIDQGFGIAVDGSGAAYVTGNARPGFPTTAGAYQTTNKTSAAKPSVFVAKLNPQGTALVYSTYIGGSAFEHGIAIAVDASGAVYVTGSAHSTDFPTTAGAFQPTHAGPSDSSDAFVSKLTPDGAGLAYSTFLGGTGAADSESGNAIAVDASGAAYVTGATNSTDFPTTVGAYQTTNSAANAAFVSKLNPSGSALEYSTFLGGSGGASGFGIAVDSTGAAYVAGVAAGGFPTKPGAYQATDPTPGDLTIRHAFVSKLAVDGADLQYSTYLGGSATDQANAVAIDGSGQTYVAGDTQSSDFPTTPGAYQTTYAGGTSDAFISKLTVNGNLLSYSTFLGGTGTGHSESATGIAVDSSGIAWVTGQTSSSNFPTTAGAFQMANAGQVDAFATKLASDGSGLYSTYLGGQCNDVGSAIAVDTLGAAYITGTSASSDAGGCAGSPPFPTTPGVLGPTAQGDDAFVSVFSERPTATTGAATGATVSSATLHGSVNPDAHATTYSFQYGTTTAYGSTTAGQSAGSDSSDHAVEQSVSGLAPNTTYHFRIVATNSGGTVAGADQLFTTNPLAPAAVTLRPTALAPTSARLNGLLNPNGVVTRYHFDYGRTTAYGASTPERSAGAGSGVVGVSRLVRGLKPGTSYHYRVVATSSGGTTSGGDLRFTTPLVPNLKISHRGTSSAGGRTPIRLTCTRARCTGTLRIDATNLRRRGAQIAASGRTGRTLKFNLAPGTRKTFRVPLPRKSIQQLGTRHNVVARVVVHLADGRTIRKLITLTAH